MNRDSVRSHIHLNRPDHVLFLSSWSNEKLPFDDIDTKNLFQAANVPEDDEDEDELNLPLNNVAFGSIKSRRLRNSTNTWNDLMISEFLDTDREHVKDQTILKKININPTINDLIIKRNSILDDSLISDDTSFNSGLTSALNTPEIVRNKPSNKNNFQTPVARIMR